MWLWDEYGNRYTMSVLDAGRDTIIKAAIGQTWVVTGYQAVSGEVEKYSELVNKFASQWISVKDRLPEEDVAVLTYGQVLNDPPDIIGVKRRYNGDQDWKHTWEPEDRFIYREGDVTHWIPLPKPPTDEEQL